MTISAYAGPLVAFGRGRPLIPASGQGFALDYNPDEGPSIFAYGSCFLDLRPQFSYQPGQSDGPSSRAFYAWNNDGVLIDQVPSSAATANIAALQAPTANTPLTLVSATGSGITVGVAITNQNTGLTVTGLLAIDGAMGSVPFGAAQSVTLWDPTKAVSRAVSLTSAANLSAVNFTIAGYDIYGFPMTQTLAGPNATTVYTTKAFKCIASVTPSGTSASTVSVGTSTIIGLPLAATALAYAQPWFNNAPVSAPTFVARDATSPATATTGDVRGTVNITGINGSGAVQLFWFPSVALMNAGVTGLFGVAQF